MTIRSGNIPAAAVEELRKGVGELHGSNPALDGVQEGVPHQTFHLGLDTIQAGSGMAGAEPVGWRYLLGTTGPEATHAAEVLTRNQVFAFAGLNRGPFVQQMVDVMRTADVPGDYEARLLRVPALYVIAVWLVNDNGNDLFIPLKPTNPVLEPGRVYQQAEFEAALVEAAQAMAAKTRPDANDPDNGPRAP